MSKVPSGLPCDVKRHVGILLVDKSESVDVVSDFIKQKDINQNIRVDLIRSVEKYLPEDYAFTGVNVDGFEFNPYDDFNMERYSSCYASDLIDYITENKKATRKQKSDAIEEILSCGCGLFTNDW